MNFRYVIGRDELIVTEKEHELVISNAMNGIASTMLRNNTVKVTWNKVNLAKPTSLPTDEQRKNTSEIMKLAAPERKPMTQKERAEFMRKVREHYERTGRWVCGKDCACAKK